jgi:hypothetical protein
VKVLVFLGFLEFFIGISCDLSSWSHGPRQQCRAAIYRGPQLGIVLGPTGVWSSGRLWARLLAVIGKDRRRRGWFGLAAMNGSGIILVFDGGMTRARRIGVEHGNELWGTAEG